jgi:hypothetical protein
MYSARSQTVAATEPGISVFTSCRDSGVMGREDAIIGLSFLVPGVVSLSLPPAFAMPAAYGYLAAGILAMIAASPLWIRTSWAISIVWVFNVWRAFDLLYAVYQGQIGVSIGPGALGAAFFIPTLVVPPLLVTHGLISWLLLLPRR